MHVTRQHWSRGWVPWFVLAVGLISTGLVAAQLRKAERAETRRDFEDSVKRTQGAILSRLDRALGVLRATAGFFAGASDVAPTEFQNFIAHLRIDYSYPGIALLGYIEEQHDTEEAIAGPAPTPLLHATPYGRENLKLSRVELGSHPALLRAMQEARDQSSEVLSAPIIGDPAKPDEIYVYGFLPVFPTKSGLVEAVDPARSGLAFLAIRLDTLLRTTFPPSSQGRLTMALYDGESPTESSLLFRSRAGNSRHIIPRYATRTTIGVPGRIWTLEAVSGPRSNWIERYGTAAYAATVGALISLLLFAITWGLVRAHAGAQSIAEELRRSEEVQRELNETLERRVAERTAEAEQRAVQLRSVALQLSQAEQQERNRIARVLHDDLQQLLVAVRLRVERLVRHSHSDEEAEELAYADELLAQAIHVARSLSVDLSPPILRERGLTPALEWLARRMELEHHLNVRLDIRDDATPESEEAKLFVLQAVRELLFNVVKHAGVREATIRVTQDDSNFILCVEDYGNGFDQGVLSTKLNGEEHFGLVSIRQRLDLLGGSSDIESSPGNGTRVILRLPRELAAPAAATAEEAATTATPAPGEQIAPCPSMERPRGQAPAAQHSSKIRVLLVDDHKIVRQGLAGLLQGEQDIELVGEAADGLLALDMTRKTQPDVVVMDVTMPRMNGIEATRHITTEYPRVRVIGLSMHEKDDMEAAMREAGAETYLSKDGAATTLVEAIRATRLNGSGTA